MTEDLPAIPNPELVFGFVAPIGADVDAPIALFTRYFENRGYRVELIKVTKVFPILKRFIKPEKPLIFSPLYHRYKSHIAYGNQLREFFGDNAFLAKTALFRILMKRNRRKPLTDADRYQKTVFIIQQFKRKEEIELLRHIYGRLFFQVSIYSRRSARIDYLARRFAHSEDSSDIDACRKLAEDVVQQDTKEIGSPYGQSVGDTFHDADFIVNADIPTPSVERWSCFLNHFGGKIRWIAGLFTPPVSRLSNPFHKPRSGSIRRCRNGACLGCSSRSSRRYRAGLRSRSRTHAGRRTRISASATIAR